MVAAPEIFVFSEAVCVESFAAGWSDPISKGRVYPKDHPMVVQYPEYWRLLGHRGRPSSGRCLAYVGS